MRGTLLRLLFRLFPFDLKGDCVVPLPADGIRISCVINFYGRLDLLAGILWSLVEQKYPPELFEVLLVEDRNGTEAGKEMAQKFSQSLPVRYFPLDTNFGNMGYSRNFGLSRSRGEVILFLDDDTVIQQPDFLAMLDSVFSAHPEIDAVVPHGHASYSCVEDRYGFHDPFFMTSRCTAYRRDVLMELGGFMSHFVGQEDVEFVTRFVISGRQSLNMPGLHYFHPPLLVPNIRKPRAVGFSFFSLKSRYSLPIWILLLLNCARHAPLLLLPIRRCREQGRFGLGFLRGVVDGLMGSKEQVYG